MRSVRSRRRAGVAVQRMLLFERRGQQRALPECFARLSIDADATRSGVSSRHVVRKMRSPTMIGDEWPMPGRSTFQAIFSCRSVPARLQFPIMKAARSTTILSVRRDDQVALGGDGQVTLGNTVAKSDAIKIRRVGGGKVLTGFAGSAGDAFALLERFEKKLAEFPDNLRRAAIELAKEWRTDRALRRLEAMLAVADKQTSLMVSGAGDVIEPTDGVIGDWFGRAIRPVGGEARCCCTPSWSREKRSSRRR